MEELTAWVDASLNVIRAGFAPGASGDAKKQACAVCLSLHAMLSPAHLIPLGPGPQSASGPDVLDTIMAKLTPFLSTAPVGFTPVRVKLLLAPAPRSA